MQGIQALREHKNALVQDLRNMLDQNPGDKWTKELGQKYDAGLDEIDRCDAEIKRINDLNQRVADDAMTEAIAERAAKRGKDEKSPQMQAFAAWMLHGADGVNALVQAGKLDIRNTMSTTTTTQGGYTVPTEVATKVTEALKMYGGMRAVSDVIQTSSGADINYPTSDGTSETGELIAQNTTANALDPSFGVVTLSTYKFSSKIIAVPFELLQDTVIDMESFISNRIAMRLGRAMNTYFTTGTGTGQPQGIVTAAGSGKVGLTGQTLTMIFDDVVDLAHSVDPAYRSAPGKVGFMMADSSIKVLRKLKDGQQRPLWVQDFDQATTNGVPGTLYGYPVYINQDVAAMGVSAKSVLFGNFGYYTIRDVMDLAMFRFTDSAYTKLGQVGFLAWQRSGGTYIGVTGAVNYYQNSAT